jgi:acyl-CoA synthetase (NDP forming)
MRPSREQLATFFRPRNVALVGASDKSAWSQMVFARFGEYGHEGQLYAVNRNGTEAHGLPGYQRIADIPAEVDTAFIFVPAAGVIGALQEAASAGVRNAVVLSSGFAEAGAEGAALQAELVPIRWGLPISQAAASAPRSAAACRSGPGTSASSPSQGRLPTS